MRRTWGRLGLWVALIAVVVVVVFAMNLRRTPSPSVGSPSTDSSAVQAEWGLAGDGSTTTDAFPLAAGALTITARCECEGAFSIRLQTGDGTRDLLVSDGVGDASLQETLQLSDPGDYRLQVEATGSWELTVQPGADDGGAATTR